MQWAKSKYVYFQVVQVFSLPYMIWSQEVVQNKKKWKRKRMFHVYHLLQNCVLNKTTFFHRLLTALFSLRLYFGIFFLTCIHDTCTPLSHPRDGIFHISLVICIQFLPLIWVSVCSKMCNTTRKLDTTSEKQTKCTSHGSSLQHFERLK